MTVLTESRALHGERQGGPSVGLNIAQDSIPPSVKMRQALWGIQWRVELVLTHLLEGLVVLLVVGHDGGGEGGAVFCGGGRVERTMWRTMDGGSSKPWIAEKPDWSNLFQSPPRGIIRSSATLHRRFDVNFMLQATCLNSPLS